MDSNKITGENPNFVKKAEANTNKSQLFCFKIKELYFKSTNIYNKSIKNRA